MREVASNVPKTRYRNHFLRKFIFWLPLLITGAVSAQKITIPDKEVSLNRPFTLVVSSGEDITGTPVFPELKGFRKTGISTSSSTTIANGNINQTNSIIQNYQPIKEGTFMVGPFKVKLGEKFIAYNQQTAVKVLAKEGADQTPDPINRFDAFEDFFSGRNTRRADVKADAFLALDNSKSEVWLGEGFNLSLSLYVAEDNRADMDFYNLQGQLGGIIKKVKPANCWEESFGIVNVQPEPVRINNKLYNRYRIWQSTMYPLGGSTIQFPSVSLRMVKYKSGGDPFFNGLNREREFKDFRSKAFNVKVKPLPPTRMPNVMGVGDYVLEEGLTKNKLNVGQSVLYEFNIKGEGNISAINMPVPASNDHIDIFPPTITQNINRGNERVYGNKKLAFLLQPRQAGRFRLGQEGFTFYFFNTRKNRYDSLVSRLVLQAAGETRMAKNAQSTYQDTQLSNRLIYLDGSESMKVIGNFLILLLTLAAGIALFVKARAN